MSAQAGERHSLPRGDSIMSKKKAAKKTAKKRTIKKKIATKKSATKKAVKRKVATKKSAKKKSVKRKATKATRKATTKKSAKRVTKRVAPKRTTKKKAPARKKVAPETATPMMAQQPEVMTVPATPAETLLELAKRLHDNPKFLEDVRLAIESPNDYVESFAGELEDRGIEEAVPSLPWIALTDGLARYGALTFLDWKFGPDDLTTALDQLPIPPEGREQLKGMVGYSTSEEGLAAAGDRLLAAGLALVTVDNNEVEDNFPIAVIKAADVAPAQRLAGELGLGSIRQWSSAG
jgi:chemotaxis protein histidine kinase CheA